MSKKHARCVICGQSTRRKINPRRPCCSRCEKTAPSCVSSPGCFEHGTSPAATLARKVIAEVSTQGRG